MFTTCAVLVMLIISVHTDQPRDDALYKIPASGARYFCFEGYGCASNFVHSECNAHCKDHTFVIGACHKIHYVNRGGHRDHAFHCCCFGEAARIA